MEKVEEEEEAVAARRERERERASEHAGGSRGLGALMNVSFSGH